jgi:autotransporter passenger strand-loop-strand repeat protein
MPTVASGQTLSVTSGQTSTGVIVDSGGTLDVLFGGKVSSTVDSGSLQIMSGKSIAATIYSGGFEQILAGIDSLTTISSGGFAQVHSGATAIGTKIEGFQRVEGKASGAKVSSSGDQSVESTGTAISTTVSSGGQQDVFFRRQRGRHHGHGL